MLRFFQIPSNIINIGEASTSNNIKESVIMSVKMDTDDEFIDLCEDTLTKELKTNVVCIFANIRFCYISYNSLYNNSLLIIHFLMFQ